MDRLAVNLTESQRNPVVVFGAAYELNNSEFFPSTGLFGTPR
jgi:hypothetical protein